MIVLPLQKSFGVPEKEDASCSSMMRKKSFGKDLELAGPGEMKIRSKEEIVGS